ncbi:MAG: CBS domain-containing protein [Gemmatimonadota bacterium]
MKLTARDVMTSPAITARRDLTVRELIQLLRRARITGVPVVDEADRLVGVISLTDLVALCGESREAVGAAESDFHTSPAMDSMASIDDLLQPPEEVLDDPIDQIMSTRAITAPEEASLGRLADLMITHTIHRVVVVRAEQVVGVVSVRDILRGLRDWDRSQAGGSQG